jgi:hypothetical protein
MTDDQDLVNIEYLRSEVLERVDAQPFDDWSPALLRALIAVFDLNGVAGVRTRLPALHRQVRRRYNRARWRVGVPAPCTSRECTLHHDPDAEFRCR